MAKQVINIGVEGNDGTGDSIRESFKKTNENFTELYAVFGVGGQINFTSLSDTPEALIPNTIALVNDAGTQLTLSELASNSALDPLVPDTITFSYDIPGKLIISSDFTKLADDLSPTQGGPLNAAGFAIGNVAISDAAADALNAAHEGLSGLTIDDLVITKGYADQRYITSGLPLRVANEPIGKLHYTWTINRYVDSSVEIVNYYDEDQVLQAGGHGLDTGANGTAIVFNAEDTDPTNLVTGTTYYLRVVSPTRLYLYSEANKAYATSDVSADVEGFKQNISGAIAVDDTHTLTDASLDSDLQGNFLSDVALPRKSAVRRQGDTMTGPLILHDHPGELAGQGAPNGDQDLQAATKYYVDNTSYSSPEVLFVSSGGDDSMQGVPAGKEGTSPTYAFKTINAAAQRADILIRSAPVMPGPYMQTITHSQFTQEAVVIRADVDAPVYEQTRNLLTQNREYIQKEVLGFISYEYPNFSYNQDICERDVGLLIDAISLDINRGLNANYLVRQAAERYYSSVSGRLAITAQLTETVASINFARDLTSAILQNNLYQEKTIDDITRASIGTVITTGSHGWSNGNIVLFQDIGGMSEIEGVNAYIKVISSNTFELFTDSALTIPLDTSSYTGYTTGGVVGLRYQTDVDQFIDDGNITISAATQTNPVRVTTTAPHFLTDNDEITIASVNGMTDLNGNTYHARKITDTVIDLYNSSFSNTEISNVALTNPVRLTTTLAHGLSDSAYITITQVSGTTELNQNQYYAKVIDSTTIDLYSDLGLATTVDGTAFTTYVGSGYITQNSTDGTGFGAYTSGGTISKDSDADPAARSAVTDKWNLITNILQNGIDAGSSIVYGSTYKIVVTNGASTYVDQTNPNNVDVLPGKVIRGKRSEALGQVVSFANNQGVEAGTDPVLGGTDPNPTVFQVQLLSATDFVVGEPLEFGNFVKEKQVVIRIEAGIYEEDYPIKLNNNVSLKGDEFRRVIIKPKTETNSKQPRVSQSPWAQTYFYRDNTFDGLTLTRGGTPFVNQEGTEQGKFGYHYLYRPEIPINVGSTITNVGGYTDAAAILEANKEYIVEETIQYITDRFPYLSYDRTKCRRDTRIIVDALINDLTIGGEEKTLETQGSYHELGYTDFLTQLGDSTQEIATDAAIGNISQLISSLFAGTSPSYTVVDATFTPTDAVYTHTTGNLVLTIGSHSLEVGQYIEIEPNGLTFQCSYSPGTSVSFPRSGDPAYQTKLEITAKGATTITVNVGTSIYDHDIFIGATTNSVTYGEYTAGSAAVLASVSPDTSLGSSESGTVTIAGNMITKIRKVFDIDYNPPLRNDEMDVFLMADQTIVRNVTCRGHGGFMCVLDPTGQVLTKSPYIQTASSFSKSTNQKIFAGGMYVDAYVGNLPTNITGKVNNFRLTIQSDEGQGLRLRPPELPCPFYVEGRRYQVNAISDYNGNQGTATIYLDASSNDGTGYDETQFADTSVTRSIFLQTAGNRSILANDFTQINDLGYGLVANNAAFSEQVSTFTYYCHAAMYANNGSEIRALNCSNGYGNFGLVAEGADPNEIPDQVTLLYDMVMPAKAFTTTAYTNATDEPSITVFDMKRPPTPNSLITIDHGGVIGVLNYVVSQVTNLSDSDNDGTEGESGDVVNTGVSGFDAGSLLGTTAALGTYTNLATYGAASGGSGLTVDVIVTGVGPISGSGSATVSIVNPGSGYATTDTITIAGDSLDGSSPANDLTIDVDTIFGTTAGVFSDSVYKLDLRADEVIANDFYGTLQDTVAHGTIIDYRDNFTHTLDNANSPSTLVTRPSTAINFDESDDATYRSISFQTADAFSQPLAPDEVLTTFEIGYDFVQLEVSTTYMNTVDPDDGAQRFGTAQGDTKLAIVPLSSDGNYPDSLRITRDSRTQSGLQPGDGGYTGGMRFLWDGKTHQVTNYTVVNRITCTGSITVFAGETITQTSGATATVLLGGTSNVISVTDISGTFDTTNTLSGSSSGALGANSIPTTVSLSSWAFIEFSDVALTNINPSPAASGLNSGLAIADRILHAGAHAACTAEITVSISLLRATGHDFTQIGTGSFNDSNYPNVILGDPVNSLADFYTDAESATSAQVWERRKGRVFFVSSDQDGFFRVGKFFSVDQSTGSITFSGEVGLSNANALGFKKGVTINEFSADDAFADDSGQAVPTEKAIGNYINRVLGYNVKTLAQIPSSGNRIGPGFLPLNGASTMEGNLNMGTNNVQNLALPSTGTDATNKNYVDASSEALSSFGSTGASNNSGLRDFVQASPSGNELLVATGNKIIYTEPESGGSGFVAGQTITGSSSGATGTIVEVITVTDNQFGNSRKIVYTANTGIFTPDSDTITNSSSGIPVGDSAVCRSNPLVVGVGGPYNEYTHASESTNSDINYSLIRTGSNTEFNLQIEAGAIINADVNSAAAIAQSKLAMNAATTRNNATGITQGDRGLASFDSYIFSASSGWISLADAANNGSPTFTPTSGIKPSKLEHISTDRVLGRSAAGVGAVSAISFDTVLDEGGGLRDSEFPTYISGTDVLLRTAAATYSVKTLSSGNGNDTVALRSSTGQLRATGYILGGNNSYEVLSISGTTLNFKTPGQATVLTAVGATSETLAVDIPGHINVGKPYVDTTVTTLRTTESQVQTNTGLPADGGRSGKGWVSSNWIYTKGIEDIASNGDTGIVFGNNVGFSEGGADKIVFFTNQSAEAVIGTDGMLVDKIVSLTANTDLTLQGSGTGVVYIDDDATVTGSLTVSTDATVTGSLTVNGNIDLGNASTDTLTITASIDAHVLPKDDVTSNLGSSSKKWNTVYAGTFSGIATSAKYADLAEKYLADAQYEVGTVLVFGGKNEVTVTDKKSNTKVAGVVSTNPAYLMNSELEGNTVVPLALQGRVPIKVVGKVEKGDMLVTSAIPGYAIVDNSPSIGTVIGKAVGEKTDDGKGTVEVVIGRV